MLVKAMMLGHWVLLDELNLASQQVLEGFNALLDHRREVFIPQLDRVVQCAPSFRLFAAQNPSRDGGGRKGLPRSFLNRFSRITVQQLAPPDLEAVVLSRWNASQSAGSSKNAQYSLTLLRLVESLKVRSTKRRRFVLLTTPSCLVGGTGYASIPWRHGLGMESPGRVSVSASCGTRVPYSLC